MGKSREALRTSWKQSVDQRGYPSWDVGSLRYLINLSNKHDIDPHELLNSFFKAEKNNNVKCGPLKIELRERAKDYAVFILTRKSDIVAQMRFKNKLWENQSKTNRLYTMLVARNQPLKKYYPPPSSIKELRKGMKNINLRAKVTGKSKEMLRYSRYNGNPLRLCVATLTDSSGSIRLPLWNDQIDSISIGDEIEIKNAYIKVYENSLHIVPNRKKGELTIIKPSKPVIVRT